MELSINSVRTDPDELQPIFSIFRGVKPLKSRADRLPQNKQQRQNYHHFNHIAIL